MRTPSTVLKIALLVTTQIALPGCGNSSEAEELFGPAPSAAGSGAASGGDGAASGGQAGTSPDAAAGGYGGSGATGGFGGSGGYGGTGATGGFGGAGGDGGMGATGGYGGTGGDGGTGATGGFGGTSGDGGGPPALGDVPCPTFDPNDADECPVPTEACCLSFADNEHGDCVPGNQGPTCETAILCNAPADCPSGQVCCGHLVGWSGTSRYDTVRCQPSCDGQEDIVFCDPWDSDISCDWGQSCEASAILPEGFYVCQ